MSFRITSSSDIPNKGKELESQTGRIAVRAASAFRVKTEQQIWEEAFCNLFTHKRVSTLS